MKPYIATPYERDFEWYYAKAKFLQEKNLNPGIEYPPVGDPLMDQVSIYDTVERRYAGFSKVLQDLFGFRGEKPEAEAFARLRQTDQAYLCLVHRVTGSGASFEKDHGYRNTIVSELVLRCKDSNEMACLLYSEVDQAQKPRAIFTSIGNQIPPFPKPQAPYIRGGLMYLCAYAPKLAYDFVNMATTHRALGHPPLTIREAVEWCCEWHKQNSLKKFHFVLTAWIMDFGDYWPELVDPWSITDYGKNALEALNLLYTSTDGKALNMRQVDDAVANLSKKLVAKPMDLEDVLCDFIRYQENYIPRSREKTYDHLDRQEVFNASLITDHPHGRQRWKLGTPEWTW